MLNWTKNRTTIYMLPFITQMYDESLYCYMGINEFKDISFSIYVTGNEESVKKLKKQDNFQGITYINNKPLCMMYIPTRYQQSDYMKFIVGNYRQMENKRILLEYWAKFDRYIYSKLYTIFYDSIYTKEILAEELKSNTDDFGKNTDKHILENVLKSMDETDNILKLEDELFITENQN